MRAIDRKLLRDFWHLKSQMLAIVVVLSCGVGTFVMSTSIHASLTRILQQYYSQNQFGDLFVSLKRAPDSLTEQLDEIPSIARWEARIVAAVRLEIEHVDEPVVGQLISLPKPGQSGLNQLFLRTGRLPEPNVASEVAISETLAIAHHLQLGDAIVAVINGHRQMLRVVGIALSPEYIYEIPPGGILPDNKSFGVLWMDRQTLAAAVDMTGAFNNLTIKLRDPRDQPNVIQAVDEITSRYGGLGTIDRSDHPSHKFIENELGELRRMSLVAPSIFLSVAAFLLNIVLARLIATQREQIAALKAFGYMNREVAWHYLKMAMISAVLGAFSGTLLGVYLGRGMTRMYTRFFHFPHFDFFLPSEVVIWAWMISCGCAAIAVWASIRQVMRMPPAEAMRPEPPANYRKTWMEIVGSWLIQTSISKMILRQIARTPRRSILSVLGISLAIAVLVVGSFMQDSVDFLFDAMFRLSQRYDVNVALVEPTSATALHELRAIPGVLTCEGYRAVSARIRFGFRQRLTGLQGMTEQSDLHKLIDAKLHSISVPVEGLLISAELAKILHARTGDVLTVEVLEGSRPVLQLPLMATLDDFAGTSAYIKDSQLCDELKEGSSISGAYLAIDPACESSIYQELKVMPKVAKVSMSRSTRQSFRNTIAENIRMMRLINLLFSCAISIGVVYSTARISFAERSRELATMRVLGFSRGEVTWMIIAELSLLTIAAIPLGCCIGHFLAWSIIHSANQELFRMPFVINWTTYLFASAIVLIATVIACLLIKFQIDRLDLVEVLKSRE